MSLPDSEVTVGLQSGSRTWHFNDLNLSSGGTGVSGDEWTNLISYVLDGLGLRAARATTTVGDDALGVPYGQWYRSVVHGGMWGNQWPLAPPQLPEKTTAMILRTLAIENPAIFAGIKAAAPMWAQSLSDAVSEGDNIGVTLAAMFDAGTLAAVGKAATHLEEAQAREEARQLAYAASAARTQEGAPTTTGLKKWLPVAAIATALLVMVVIIIKRRR